MPMKYVEPEVYLVHNGITIYHTYGDSFTDRKEYWFSTDHDEDNEEYHFDVRDMFHRIYKYKVPRLDDVDNSEFPSIEDVVKESIDNGLLRIPLWQRVSKLENMCANLPQDIFHELIDTSCERTAETVKGLALSEQIVFLFDRFEDEVYVENFIRTFTDANKT